MQKCVVKAHVKDEDVLCVSLCVAKAGEPACVGMVKQESDAVSRRKKKSVAVKSLVYGARASAWAGTQGK